MKYINNVVTKVVITAGPVAYGIFYAVSEFLLHALKIPHWH